MNYRSLRPVYTIVLYESSPAEFHKFPGNYIHRFRQTSDTGLEMNLLEEYVFVPLDILKEIVQNRKKISNELEAWLAFFCMNDPEWILKLSETINQKEALLNQKDAQLSQKDAQIAEQASQLSEKDAQLNQQENLIAELQSQIQKMQKHFTEKK